MFTAMDDVLPFTVMNDFSHYICMFEVFVMGAGGGGGWGGGWGRWV